MGYQIITYSPDTGADEHGDYRTQREARQYLKLYRQEAGALIYDVDRWRIVYRRGYWPAGALPIERGGRCMTPTHAGHNVQDAVELRQYIQILQAAQQAARAYQRRTGARINWTNTTLGDLAADAYIIAREAPDRSEDRQGDKLRRAAYEAARRAVRAQQRHHHADLPEGDGAATRATRPDVTEDTAAIRDAVAHAGPVAAMLAHGLTVSEIADCLGVSRSTAWRLADRARSIIVAALAER